MRIVTAGPVPTMTAPAMQRGVQDADARHEGEHDASLQRLKTRCGTNSPFWTEPVETSVPPQVA